MGELIGLLAISYLYLKSRINEYRLNIFMKSTEVLRLQPNNWQISSKFHCDEVIVLSTKNFGFFSLKFRLIMNKKSINMRTK